MLSSNHVTIRIEYRINYIRGTRHYGPDARRPLTGRHIVPPYSLTFLSTTLIKTKIALGEVFLITSGFSLPEPKESCDQKQDHTPLR